MSLYQERLTKVCRRMEEAGLSQLLVTDHLSIYYLTGIDVVPFERFWCLLVKTDGTHTLFANRLFALGETGLPTVTLTDTDDVAAAVAPYIVPGPLGVDKNMAARFLLPILAACPAARAVLGSGCVDSVRARKDEAEKALMRRASDINDRCMEQLAAYIHEGATEGECADYLVKCYGAFGCEGLAFDPIVSFGANAADPHHEPDDTVLKPGDCVLLDMGCIKDRYCSDMTRTWFCGQPTEKQAAVHELVRRANEAAEALIKPGVRFCDLDAAARSLITAAGYGEYFNHRLGHFIGQTDHEKGDVSSANTAVAKPGMIFSIEPGIYLPGEFGVRIEDLVLVTETGCEVLNRNDKHWAVVGQ